MKNDTVFNRDMRIVFNGEPHDVLRRLKHPHPESWYKVCVGDTEAVVTIPEYLYQDTYKATQKLLWDLVDLSRRPMFRRDRDRLDTSVRIAARKLIELVQKELT